MDDRDDRERHQAAPEPEAGGRLLLGWILIVLGVVMVFAGWLGVSGNPQVAVQLPYLISGGIGGLLAGIVGVGLLVSDDIRKDRARIGRLEAAVLEMREFAAAQAEAMGLAGSRESREEGGSDDETTVRPYRAAGEQPAANGRIRAGARRR
ncbi:MAG TPA: hypothetical protein VM841_11820 [Actinomycetota bacterium]|nr:hypothetical protein [Actinomycetota bacterium]